MYGPDLSKYCQVMEEIKRRIEVVKHFLSEPEHALYQATAIESMALQMRKVLELIALGSLVANQDNWNRSARELRNAWKASDIFKQLKKTNPDSYPQPVIEVPGSGSVKSHIQDRTEGYLTEELFGEIYGKLGKVLHADNPLASPMDYDDWLAAIPEWMDLVVNLLNSHTIRLADNPNMFLIHMQDESDGNVKGYVFQPLIDEQEGS